MSEEVSEVRFATLENEVKHITSDVAEIKATTKSTGDAIRSIDISIAAMSEIIKHNRQIGPRVEKLERDVSGINAKMAAYAGGIAVITFIIVQWPKIKVFLG